MCNVFTYNGKTLARIMEIFLWCFHWPTFAFLGSASIMGAWVRHGQQCEIWCQLRQAVIYIWFDNCCGLRGEQRHMCAAALPTTWLYSWAWWLKRDNWDITTRSDQLQWELLEIVFLSNGFYWVGTQFSQKTVGFEKRLRWTRVCSLA